MDSGSFVNISPLRASSPFLMRFKENIKSNSTSTVLLGPEQANNQFKYVKIKKLKCSGKGAWGQQCRCRGTEPSKHALLLLAEPRTLT